MCNGTPECRTNCGTALHDDYDSLTEYQADRFMSLLTYLFHKGYTNQNGSVRRTRRRWRRTCPMLS
ncbi:hypothetical protein BV25DRAFT_1832063 [Artomyces pyxidatus]|uniref:Uncharacterized protein n=1 Tax=Artomyces pyxidatus TaxID=48021 RepID=A0ACB8SKS1_9AGAM|nr:hypothetical protein BV25DRAFT_1832063 [Artomyces pyxidatus]